MTVSVGYCGLFIKDKIAITESGGKLAMNSILGMRETKGKERRRWSGLRGSRPNMGQDGLWSMKVDRLAGKSMSMVLWRFGNSGFEFNSVSNECMLFSMLS